jgi:hypothetical protein
LNTRPTDVGISHVDACLTCAQLGLVMAVTISQAASMANERDIEAPIILQRSPDATSRQGVLATKIPQSSLAKNEFPQKPTRLVNENPINIGCPAAA